MRTMITGDQLIEPASLPTDGLYRRRRFARYERPFTHKKGPAMPALRCNV